MIVARAARHLELVHRRHRRSRYDERLVAWQGLAPAGRVRPPAEAWSCDPRTAEVADVRVHPLLRIEIAREALQLEDAAPVWAAAYQADLDGVRHDLGANLLQLEGGTVLLATRGMQTVGAAVLVLDEDVRGPLASLHLGAVAPTFQGRGIALQLGARALDLAGMAGVELVLGWPTPAAQATAARLGLRPPAP